MANAPNPFRSEGGYVMHGKAGATLTVGYLLDVYTDSTLILATDTRKGTVGVARATYASGDDASYHKGGRSTVNCGSATVKAGDHLKVSSTNGVATTDGTSGSTVQTADTFAIAKTDKDADNLVLAEWVK